MGASVGAGVEVGVAVRVGVDVIVGAGVAVGMDVALGTGVGDGVDVGSNVAVAMGVDVEVGAGAGVATGVRVGVGIAVGNGLGVGCGDAVAAAGTGVSAAGDAACSPPQPARAVRAVRYSSSTAEATPVLIRLPRNEFMAPFSALGTVWSMPRPVYLPGVRLTSPLPVAVPCPLGAPMAKTTRPGERAQATVRRTGGYYSLEATLLPSVVHSWQTGSVFYPGLRPVNGRPVVRTGISGSKGLFSRCHEVVVVGGLFLLNPSPVGLLQHGIGDVEGALGKILRILDEAFRHAGDKPVHGFCCIVVTEFFPG